jgi:hypothetical protein
LRPDLDVDGVGSTCIGSGSVLRLADRLSRSSSRDGACSFGSGDAVESPLEPRDLRAFPSLSSFELGLLQLELAFFALPLNLLPPKHGKFFPGVGGRERSPVARIGELDRKDTGL